MTRTKKVLGLLLALAMVFGCMTMAFATDPGAAARAASITVATTATELAAGETATVTVSATTNFTASTASIPVFYNKTLVSVSGVTAAADTVVGASIIATDATATDSTLVYANTGYDAATYGYVLVQFTAENGATVADTLSNTALITFTVTALADVEGDALVVVPATALKTTSNANGKLYFGCSTEGTTVAGVPELVSNIDTTAATATIAIGETMLPADLALTDAGSTAGVIIDKNKTFGGAYAGVVYGFSGTTFTATTYLTDALQATNGGSFTIARKTGVRSGYGTGTTLTVLNADGSATGLVYVVVIFGDIDGNGRIQTADVTAVKAAVSSTATIADNSPEKLAANCVVGRSGALMHTVQTNDVTATKGAVTTALDAAALAAKHASFNTNYQ